MEYDEALYLYDRGMGRDRVCWMGGVCKLPAIEKHDGLTMIGDNYINEQSEFIYYHYHIAGEKR